MTNRQNTFLLKRSNIPGKIPLPGDLKLGELALNTADGILYTSGTTSNSILPIGWDRISRTGDTVTGSLTVNDLSVSNNLSVSGTVISQFVSADFMTSLSGLVNNLVVDNLEVDNALNIFAPTVSNSSITAVSFSGGSFYGDGSNLTGITSGLSIKSNTVTGSSFSGNPKTVTVAFTTPYPNTNYSISITGGANRIFTFESKTVNGFTINANANLVFTENVDWMTIAHGES